MKLNILLSGIVGSRAYGLDRKGSDTDLKGIYAAPTTQMLGLTPPPESLHTTNPDVTFYELRRFVQLALQSNPTVIELLWLPHGLYKTTSLLGQELIELRDKFLSATKVQAAYLGYANRQLAKLQPPGRNSTRDRRQMEKDARHLFRLLHQGLHLYTTGKLVVRLEPETIDRCRAVAAQIADGETKIAADLIGQTRAQFDNAATPLPQNPDGDRMDRWLRQARIRLLSTAVPDVQRPAQM